MIAGNHEHYGRDIDIEINKALHAASGTNVTVLQNSTAIIRDVLFIGATFWTDFDLFKTPEISMAAAADGLNDYRKIRTERYSRRLRPHHTVARHLESRAFVEATLRRPKTTSKRILVTHHPLHPVFDVCRPASRKPNDRLAPAYMSDALWLFELGLDAAISGHVHASFDTTIGHTRVVANPKGYGPWQTGGRWENPDFNPHFRLTI
jgi:hypothetical protein